MLEIFETRDVALLRGLLETDRVAGAYFIGDLDAPFFEQGRWLVAARDHSPIALVLVFEAFAEPVVLSFGEAEGVAAIVAAAGPRAEGRGLRAPLPPRCYLKVPPEHEAVVENAFEILEREAMNVMALGAGMAEALSYRGGGGDVRRLGPDFPLDQILDVYRSYPGHFFEPRQLTSGIYFGSFEGDRLVAVAGTHVYSRVGRVAAVGNIVTAVDARGRGHASACASEVIRTLREQGCDTIVLHVAASNAPALACYRHLGFERHGHVLQLKGISKRTVAPPTPVRGRDQELRGARGTG